MKKVLFVLVFVLVSFSSYYLGQLVGHDQAWTRAYAMISSHSATMLSAKFPASASVEELKEYIYSSHISDFKDGIITYGRFKDSYTSRFPMFIGQDKFSESLLGLALTRYPEIENTAPIKYQSPSDEDELFHNERVDWFYSGIKLIKSERHNKTNHLDR